jgi:predicted porin
MKKRLIAVVALALVSGMAAAQSSVTLYGNVDVGLLTQNRSADTLANTTDNGRATTLANGGISPSIWGFRGAEELVYADANSGATAMTTMVAGGTMANANTTLLNVGIRHSF